MLLETQDVMLFSLILANSYWLSCILKVMTLQEAKALLKEDDDLIIAVYDYWLNKRLRLVSFKVGRSIITYDS